ncbi:MAG: hypothetical protein GWN58_48585, partial [Anaerolineae bacterium]|nr:hypothetical protein [Anaerolineae bacterium]
MTTTEGSRLEPEQQPAEMGAEDPFDTAKPSRPGFVTWLAILEVLGGVFAVVVLLLGRQGVFGAVSDPLQFSQQHVVFTLFYAAVHVAAGIGMWLGRPWGWWLAAFSFLYSLVNNVSSLLLLPDMVGSSGEPDIRAGSYVIRELFDIGWDLIVLAYWFREGVRDYFGLLDFSRLKAIAGLVAVTILVFAAGYLLVGSASRDLDRIARLYEEGDLDTALEELELYLESHPEDDMAWTIMGHASQDAGLFEDAEAAYDRAIAINPERHEAWTGLG